MRKKAHMQADTGSGRSHEVTSWGHQGLQLREGEFRLLPGMRLRMRESLHWALRKRVPRRSLACGPQCLRSREKPGAMAGLGRPGLGLGPADRWPHR